MEPRPSVPPSGPPPRTLPRGLRLRTSREFRRVYREGNRARGEWMTVAACANGLAVTRLGLSVGRVAWRRAVKRNRVRRILREAFRLERAALPPGADLVLIAERGAWPTLADARAELVRLAHKAWRRHEERLRAAEGGA